MALRIKNDGTILIDKIVVGTPIRTVQSAGIPGVDTNGAKEGDVLVYNATLGLWQPTDTLPLAILEGGEY